MKLQNNRREITNYDLQFGRYKPSSPSAKEFHPYPNPSRKLATEIFFKCRTSVKGQFSNFSYQKFFCLFLAILSRPNTKKRN